MAIYQNIVVGTDGTPTATGALSHAARLAALTGATLHVTCVRPAAPALGGHEIASALAAGDSGAEAAKEVLEQALLFLDGRGFTVEAHAPTGDPATCLVELAAALKADLIVVGSRGMHGGRRLLGSVPNKVTHHAGCHVLVVNTT